MTEAPIRAMDEFDVFMVISFWEFYFLQLDLGLHSIISYTTSSHNLELLKQNSNTLREITC